MITIKDFMETVNYAISGGDPFQWSCFGPNARTMDADENNPNWSASIVYDTKTRVVYEATVCDYVNNRAYRLTHPDFTTVRDDEAESRGLNNLQAWDDIDFIELDVDEDWLEKATAIVNGEEYSTDVSISVEVPTDILYKLMLQAHKENITFNEYMTKAIQEYIEFL